MGIFKRPHHDFVAPGETLSRRVAAVLATCAAAAGGLTLAGWMLEMPRLTNWTGTGISMLPNTAFSTLMGGLAILLLAVGARGWAAAPAAVVLIVGGGTLFQHLTGVNLGIDTMLHPASWGQAGTTSPGRTGPPASLSLTLLGVAILLRCARRAGRLIAGIGVLVGAIVTLSFLGYLFGADRLYSLPRFTAIALPTSISLLLLALALLASVPERDPVRTLLEPTAAGMLVRRALPLVIVVLIGLGWARLQGERVGLYDTAFGTAARTMLELVFIGGVLWWAASAVRAHERPLRESEEMQRRILESSRDCIKVLDLDAKLVSMSETGKRMLGVADVAGLLGRSWVDFWSGDDRAAAADAVARARGGGTGEFLGTFEVRGEMRHWEVVVTPILDEHGRPEKLLAVTRDVTGRAAAERALRRSNQELQRFAYVASHDLREPLRGVAHLSNFVLEDESSLSEEGRGRLRRICELCARLTEMIDGLLEHARAGGERGAEVCDLTDVARRAADKVAESAGAQAAEIEVRGPLPVVTGDPVLLERVFANLLSNAIKYNRSGRKRVEVFAEDGAVLVRDNGVGIDPKHHGRVFQLFARISGGEFPGGVGLGLALVKNIVESHGGQVSLRSALGEGSTFVLRFPAAAVDPVENRRVQVVATGAEFEPA